jgi:phage tail tube protein FII
MLEFRGSQQIYDSALGIYSSQAVRVSMRCVPKRAALGAFEVANTTDSESEFEVTFLKVDIGGRNKIIIDKYNFVFAVNGINMLASVASDLGV